MIDVVPIDESTRKAVIDRITRNWGSNIIVTRGTIHSAEDLPGLIAVEDGAIQGLITYRIDGSQCEIVSLDSDRENRGIGTTLIARVADIAGENRCSRLWLVTTNDNTHAMRFYQRRGFTIAGIHLNAIQKARKIKPQIPCCGMDDIPIQHEIEFEKMLCQ